MFGQYRVNIRKKALAGTCLCSCWNISPLICSCLPLLQTTFSFLGVYLIISSPSNSYIVCLSFPCKINWIAVVWWLSTDFEMKSICKTLQLSCNFLVLFLIKREPSQHIQNFTQLFLFSEIAIRSFHCTIPFQVYSFTALLKIKA